MSKRTVLGLAVVVFATCAAGFLVVAQAPPQNNGPDVIITAAPQDQTVCAGDEATVTFTQQFNLQNPPVNAESTAKADKVEQTSVVEFGDNTSEGKINELLIDGLKFLKDGTKQGITVKFSPDRRTATITKTDLKTPANTVLIRTVGVTGTFPTIGKFTVSMQTSVLITINGKPVGPLTGKGEAIVRTAELVIVSASPDPLILGNDLSITYHVATGLKFDSLELNITNKAGKLVFQATGLPFDTGDHVTSWPKAKWNQKPHLGSFANPANGPYSLQLKGTHVTSGKKETCLSNIVKINTLLVIETDLVDDKPTPQEIASGLYRPSLDLTSPERLQVGLIPTKGGQVTFATALPTISNIVEEDLDNDPTNGLEVKSAHVRQVMQSTFANGKYNVVLKNVRDLAGNFGVQGGDATTGVVTNWVIQLD